MTKEVINDWVVQVGFDDKAVVKGAKRVERTMKRLVDKQAKPSKKAEASTIKQVTANKKVEDSLKRQNTLQAKRLQLLRSIERAKVLGLKTQGFSQSLRGAKIPQLEKRRLELEKLITLEKRKQRASLATKAKIKAPVAFGLSDDRQLRLTNSIDTVMRRAARSVGKNTEEFKKLDATATKLKGTISGISSKVGLENLNNQIVRLRENVNSASVAMRSQKTIAQSLTQSMNNLARSYLSVFAAIEGARAFFTLGSKFDSLNASLLAASGSAEQAGKDFEFIKDLSMEMGLGLANIADGYRQIGSAARASGMESSEINKQFRQMTKLSRSFGLSAADTSLVMLAFQQMISKGVVSSEELRRQLGERLPGAVNHAANALGVTTLELSNMLKKGEVVTKDFLPKFLDQMEGFVDESGAYVASLDSITAANQRFISAVQLGIVKAFGAGAKSGVVNFLDRLQESVSQLTPLFKIFGAAVSAGLHVITAALDILAPSLAVVTTILDSFVSIFEDALDLDKASEDITILSKAVRLLAGGLLIATGSIRWFLGHIQRLIESDELPKWAKTILQLFSLISVAIVALFPIKTLKMVVRLFSSITSKILGMISALGKAIKPLKSALSLGGRVERTPTVSWPNLTTRVSSVAGAAAVGSAGGLPGLGIAGAALGVGAASSAISSAAQERGLFRSLTQERPAQEGTGLFRPLDLSIFRRGSGQGASNTVTTTNEINVSVDAPNANSSEVAVMVAEVIEEQLRENNAALASA